MVSSVSSLSGPAMVMIVMPWAAARSAIAW